MSFSNVTFAAYRPGALADVLRMHAGYYNRRCNSGLTFEVKNASELAEFPVRMNETRDLFFCAHASDSNFIDPEQLMPTESQAKA